MRLLPWRTALSYSDSCVRRKMPARPRKPRVRTAIQRGQVTRMLRRAGALGLDQLYALGAEGAVRGVVAGDVHAVAGVERRTEINAAVGTVDQEAYADDVGAGLAQEVEHAT